MIDTKIQDYAEKNTSDESVILQELRQKTFQERSDKQMLSGFYQGRLLSMLSKMQQPKRVLEIGTFTGYSALCLAEGLAEEGKIITIDIIPETNATAKEYWAKAGISDKIEDHLGAALEIIPTLNETFDLVFIDADKFNYSNYFDVVFPKVRIGGLIIADNVLWSGKVLQDEKDLSTKALDEYNKKITEDKRVSNILLPVRDGLMIARKESD